MSAGSLLPRPQGFTCGQQVLLASSCPPCSAQPCRSEPLREAWRASLWLGQQEGAQKAGARGALCGGLQAPLSFQIPDAKCLLSGWWKGKWAEGVMLVIRAVEPPGSSGRKQAKQICNDLHAPRGPGPPKALLSLGGWEPEVSHEGV